MSDNPNPFRDESNICPTCYGPMSANPHRDAGKPERLLEVGTVWVCIPCLVANRHKWATRALKAESSVESMALSVKIVTEEMAATIAELHKTREERDGALADRNEAQANLDDLRESIAGEVQE